MQTVALEFTKLDRLPIPESTAEALYMKSPEGVIHWCPARVSGSEGTRFIGVEHLLNDYTFAHLKVTTATEPKFKVGDRVTSKAYPHIQGKILHLNFETALVYDYLENYVLDLTDLTLITQ